MGAYLIQLLSYQFVLALIYITLLRQHTCFRINRIYLLVSILLPLLLPCIQFTSSYTLLLENSLSAYIPTVQNLDSTVWVKSVKSISPLGINSQNILAISYAIGAGILLLRYLRNLFKINALIYENKPITSNSELKIFRISSAQPFSFFNQIFIPNYMLDSPDFEKVLAHEQQHARQKHSYDRLLIDFILALLWINPFIYLFKKWLIEVHEFEADAAVIATQKNKLEYQMTLLELSFQTSNSGLVSFFNFSIIKRRIKMMNQKKSKNKVAFRTLLAVPFILALALLFSFKQSQIIDSPRVRSLNDIYYLLDNVVEDNIPSIFPVKIAEGVKVRVSSEFGKRMDPINKVERWHRGIDIAAPKGTPVIATADGSVELVQFQPNGYGNFVIIKHDDSYKTKYAQMDSYPVKIGDLVQKGDIIGYVGSSGRSTAPHLHYEVYKDDQVVNPADYINDYKPEG